VTAAVKLVSIYCVSRKIMDKMTPTSKPPNADHSMENILGNLLQIGVLVSAAVVALGGVIYLVRHGTEFFLGRYAVFHGEPAELRSVLGILKNALDLHGRGLIQFGLLLLIATPIMRVVFAAGLFHRQRDRLYTVVALVVFCLLLYSLFGSR
jgi:uncharacterized membrane protein